MFCRIHALRALVKRAAYSASATEDRTLGMIWDIKSRLPLWLDSESPRWGKPPAQGLDPDSESYEASEWMESLI